MDKRRIDRIGVKIEKQQAEGAGAASESGGDAVEKGSDL